MVSLLSSHHNTTTQNMAPYTLEEFGKVDLDHLVDELTLQEKISLLAVSLRF